VDDFPSLRAILHAAFLVLLGQTGCSLTVDADRVQCRSDADCTARGAAFAGSVCVASVCEASDLQWGCLGASNPAATDAGPFTVTMHVRDLLNQSPLAGVRADVCSKVDVACSDPRSTTMSDADGLVTLTIDPNFSGFVSFTSSQTAPTRYFFNPPVNSDQDIAPLSLSQPAARGALLQQLGASPDRGDILLTASDCTSAPAAGVKFQLVPESEGAVEYYLVNGLPSPNSPATDATGYGGFVNVDPGTWTITPLLEDGRELPELSLVVAQGTVTWSRVVPRGAP
jgi:hypothetical protein